MNGKRALVGAAAIACTLSAATVQPAAAAPIKWLTVRLGVHQFGHVRAADTIVARAGSKEVGLAKQRSCGCLDGPRGPMHFDLGRDRSIWVFDVLKHRLLVWRHGRPAHPARSIRLGSDLDVRDFGLGRDGTIYLYAVYADPPPGDSGANLWALTPKGKVLWRAKARMGRALRLGPDGALYSVGSGWTQLTTPSGRPLSLAQQRRRTSASEPLSAGLRLLSTQPSPHELHFALVDRAHTIVRAWRVTSRTTLYLGNALTPALVGGDPVVSVDVWRQERLEHIVLRLTTTGAGRPFALDGRAVWGDDGTGSSTPLRIGPDRRLYQLRTNPNTGLSIARYSLD
jgi:hypothetical protein